MAVSSQEDSTERISMVSGGHTALVDVQDYCKFNMIGTTVDDSVGECFDKVARVLGHA